MVKAAQNHWDDDFEDEIPDSIDEQEDPKDVLAVPFPPRKRRADAGTWGGPRVKTWDTKGKRAVMMLHPSVFSFVNMVAQSTKRTKRSLVIQIFMEGLRSMYGVTAMDLSNNDYSSANRMGARPLLTVQEMQEWATTLTSTPYVGPEE